MLITHCVICVHSDLFLTFAYRHDLILSKVATDCIVAHSGVLTESIAFSSHS